MSTADLPDIETSPLWYAEAVLGMRLYPWQDRVLSWFWRAPGKRVKGTLCTPNGAGKDSIVIAALALWWVSLHLRGRVVITSKDARQIDEQTYPALRRYRGTAEGWTFLDREVRTPTGGKITLFTTDDAGRCEGYHRETFSDGSPNPEGPLLIIVNEAKSVPEEIFEAFDRCTYDALLYASSPGYMNGTFWESHSRPELGFHRLKVGLSECPHKPREQIDDITRKYGPRHPFTLSTLHGEFMLDGAESRFDFDGLERLQKISANTHNDAKRGIISEHKGTFTFTPDPRGWAWVSEPPADGRAYLAFADPMKGEQSEGGKKRDTHGCGILRDGYLDSSRIHHPPELVAAVYVEDPEEFSGAACRWELSVLAHRLWMLAGYYGGCTIVPEENNYGGVLIKELLDLGADVWQREDMDHEQQGRRTIKKFGFQTNSKTKRYWVEELAKCIFEQTFICRFKPAVAQLAAFIQDEDGKCEARPGAFDDFVAGIGIGLTVGAYKRLGPNRGRGWGGEWRPSSAPKRTINRAVS